MDNVLGYFCGGVYQTGEYTRTFQAVQPTGGTPYVEASLSGGRTLHRSCVHHAGLYALLDNGFAKLVAHGTVESGDTPIGPDSIQLDPVLYRTLKTALDKNGRGNHENHSQQDTDY